MTTSTDSLRHQGSGMGIVPELLLRQVILEGLVELAGDEYRQTELFRRVDDMLQGTQEDWNDEFKTALRRMTNISARDGIQCAVRYPDLETRMPFVSIVPESGAEDESQATFGDLLGQDVITVGTIPVGEDPSNPATDLSARLERRQVIGNEWTTNLQLGSWTEVPEESILCHALVKHLVFRHKHRLQDAGFREIALSEGGFEPSPTMQQRTGYVPFVRCTLRWTWRQSVRKNVPYFFTLNLPTKSN